MTPGASVWFHPLAVSFLQVSLVGQEPVLFARTVKENITYGLTDIPVEDVTQAATKANAHDFITALPKGYQTSNSYIYKENTVPEKLFQAQML